MKFCSNCDTKLFQNFEDVGGPWICPKCNPEKVVPKRPTYGVNYSGNTKSCSKGCGAQIYWDDEFKSDSGKFIPIDSRTDEPHNCDGPTDSEPYYPDEIKKYTKQNEKKPEPKIPLPAEILFDVRKIPKSLVDNDGIVREIVQGHKEETLGIIHYDNTVAPDPEKISIHSLKDILSENILKGIEKYGFSGLLPFQEESIRSILEGKNSIISAPTGSGKTEAFSIPILQKISQEEEPGVFALFVYPLNALIDDQVSKISNLIDRCGLNSKVAVYSIHGGQSSEYKDMIISDASKKSLIIATNFDFINYHLILQDKKWNELFKTAKIIVMDEAHSYTSFHGSNVYHVLKRMKRYMEKVQYVGSSATLDNSKEFFSNMFDLPENSFSFIKSKIRRKHNMHMFFIMPRKFGQRTTMEMLASICYKNKSTQLIFSNSHNDSEFLASNVEDANPEIRIQIHRGGLDQNNRKLYESQMKSGELDALSCTPTLELGIDIGHVDVVISAFKNEYDSFVQRIGRAGRMGQKSYAICVFDPDDAACHYFARHIDDYLSQDHVIPINKKNPIISDKHTESIEIEEEAATESDKSQFFDFANSVNLRGTSGEIAIYYNSKKIGTRGVPVGYYQLHQNAIYHFNKQNYEVTSLIKSQNGARAYLKRSYEKQKRTIPIVRTSILQTSERNAIHRDVIVKSKKLALRYGIIELSRTITGYLKGNYNESSENFETHNGTSISSWRNFNWKSKHSSVSIIVPSEFISKPNSESKNQIAADSTIHTITHVFINAAKIVTKSESNDIDAYYENGVIYLYDNSSDGFNGCSKIIYDDFEKILDTCNSLLCDCDCPVDPKQKKLVEQGENWGGCPKCTFTTNYCVTKNKELSKFKAKEFFEVFSNPT
ncbi:DEAD/DEAH box helicase [Nitrosopumilus adriaticus]|uniref:DEAD/DEAH box helicase n=1 Tax=Nitrosopumilus adriaticus TaxID=1580092 RepID=A0A0D5C1C8_9ARCH|nr:DEAD/DEAH box helicase [Nitrosopumilus adriaticus]AJW70217.1 DEAD/DEAH box helicase [Nitrosopumilus adriaticus]